MQERKVNKGYLVIPGMKEFLKVIYNLFSCMCSPYQLQLTDPDDSIPNQPASLNSSFKNAATRLDNIANVIPYHFHSYSSALFGCCECVSCAQSTVHEI